MTKIPNFYDIDMLPTISHAIRQAYENSEGQLNNMRQAKPGTLDVGILERVQSLYQNEKELYPVFYQQLMIWKNGQPSADQLEEVNELVTINSKVEKMGNEILDICQKSQNQTMEEILDKDDLSLGIDFLTKNL